ncbi:hypothetical protein [Thermococcus stetteri]|uniref:hypothetical protein n=1 Tax=Thermococcus stetteri TaxID=49900 RepID=UPI001AE4A62C|nr:hypothetical protein [Thermococcus stetteri]MBP1912394.1 asparagine N-glycosylation enzyme membrane subunit Stt3 [Thermococcus stetteri]
MRKSRPSSGIFTILAVIMIILAFVPAYFIGYLYLVLMAVYLALFYVVERRGHRKLSMAISYLFGLVVVYLVMKKSGSGISGFSPWLRFWVRFHS